jgi:hypothetical protein
LGGLTPKNGFTRRRNDATKTLNHNHLVWCQDLDSRCVVAALRETVYASIFSDSLHKNKKTAHHSLTAV